MIYKSGDIFVTVQFSHLKGVRTRKNGVRRGCTPPADTIFSDNPRRRPGRCRPRPIPRTGSSRRRPALRRAHLTPPDGSCLRRKLAGRKDADCERRVSGRVTTGGRGAYITGKGFSSAAGTILRTSWTAWVGGIRSPLLQSRRQILGPT